MAESLISAEDKDKKETLSNCKYDMVPRNKRSIFFKELKLLLKTGLLTPIEQSQYSTTVFMIPNKGRNVGFIIDYCRLNH